MSNSISDFFKWLWSIWSTRKKEPPHDQTKTTNMEDETTPPYTPSPPANQTEITNMGGKRTKNKNGPPPPPPRPPKYRPDLICEKESGSWKICIEDNSEIEGVRQKNNLKSNGEVYTIPEIEDVEIILKNGENETISLEKDKLLIFRIRKNWQGRGRRIKHISPNYHYVVFVPKCYGSRIGIESVENEETLYDGYRAHFFPGNEGTRDGFENCGENIFFSSKYSLTGSIIHDNEGDNLFSSLPDLEAIDGFEKASEIHVGDEGTSGWRKNFNPNNSQLSDKLKGRGGWFFVRVYEGKPPLVFGDSFRFLPGLTDIKINDNSCWKDHFILPNNSKHCPTYIEFIASDDISIFPEKENANLLNQEKSGNVFRIPCREDLDKTKWTLKNKNGHEINVDIHLNRIWWRYYTKDRMGEWQATPIEIKREEIRNASTETGIEILLNYSSPLRSIRIGFKEKGALSLKLSNRRAKNYQYIGKFLLWDIKHNRNLREPISENLFLRMWIIDHEYFSVPIISVPADEPPPPSDPSGNIPEPQCPSGGRKGIRLAKGYSKKELEKAGVCYTAGMEIPIDKRRKSCHKVNVQALVVWEERSGAPSR